MSTLVNKVKGLDTINLVGASIASLVIIPSLVVLVIDLVVNGANMI